MLCAAAEHPVHQAAGLHLLEMCIRDSAYRGGYAYTLGFNCNKEDEPLNNVKVRMAICSAIDVDAVANVLTEGYYYPGSDVYKRQG